MKPFFVSDRVYDNNSPSFNVVTPLKYPSPFLLKEQEAARLVSRPSYQVTAVCMYQGRAIGREPPQTRFASLIAQYTRLGEHSTPLPYPVVVCSASERVS